MLKTEGTIFLEIKNECSSSDLCLIALLKMNNCEIIRWEMHGNKKFTFTFDHTPQVDKIVKDYFRLPIDQHPFKKFYSELKEVKNIIYNS